MQTLFFLALLALAALTATAVAAKAATARRAVDAKARRWLRSARRALGPQTVARTRRYRSRKGTRR